MSEFKGTPGPWEVVGPCCDAVGTNFDKGGWYKPIVNRPPRTGGKHTDEYNANLYLIAAAPELLAALQKLCVYAEDVCGVCPDDCHEEHPLMSAHAAIAKALGETK